MNDVDTKHAMSDSAHDGDDVRNRQRIIRFFIHSLCILILFVLPEVLMSMSRPSNAGFNPIFYFKTAVYIAVFYVNYYYIIDASLSRHGGILRLLMVNIVLMIVATLTLYVIWMLAKDDMPEHKVHSMAMTASFLLHDFVMLCLTVGLSVALKLSDRWIKMERNQQEAVMARREVELRSLKNQLNPHFLFNTLNSIYALIDIDARKAQDALHELSRLLRYVLYENPRTVTLRQEMEFIDNYVKLMRLRLSEKMPLNVTLDYGDFGDERIAPLLFVNVVENAFKYGNTGRPDQGIDISITASQGVVRCVISNFHAQTIRSASASGIGIQNLRRRLDLLYGGHASLNISDAERFVVEMSIKLDALESTNY